MKEERREYFWKRVSTGCSCCGTMNQVVDPISALCRSCKRKLLIHGSPKINKPKLKEEIELAEIRIALACDIEKAEQAFDQFMRSFASPSRGDHLRRLCWLHFIHLKAWDGEPLMRFRDALAQSYAVTIHDENGGLFDARKRQFNYCIGRASVSPWDKRRFSAKGTFYNYPERRDLHMKPTLFHRAFNEIFIGAGLSRFISQITYKLKEV